MKLFKDKSEEFFRWVKGTELVELDDIDVSEDPVRPELTLGWRITSRIFRSKRNYFKDSQWVKKRRVIASMDHAEPEALM
mgnify:CR=1 FL=1